MLLLISNVCHGSIGDSHLEPKVNFLRIPAISKVQEVGEEYNLRGVQETYPVMPSLLDTVQSISFWPLHDKWADYVPSPSPLASFLAIKPQPHILITKKEKLKILELQRYFM